MTYTANHKWATGIGHMFPNPEYAQGERPPLEANVAPWLPTAEGAFDTSMDEYQTITAGKVLAMARDGYVVPAGLKNKIRALTAGGTCWAYDANDTARRVIDILTGTYLTSTKAVLKTALSSRMNALGYLDTTGGEEADDFFSDPIGVAPYNFYQHAGGDGMDPTHFRTHNFNLQHKVSVLCDWVLELPWVPEQQAATAVQDHFSIPSTATELGTNVYSIAATANIPIAKPTSRLPWTFTGPHSLFTVNKTRSRDIKATGDYFVDDDANKVYFFCTHGTAWAETAMGTAAYYHYNSTTDPTGISNFACVIGDVHVGDLLMPTSKSNWKPVSKANGDFDLGTNDAFIATNISTGFTASDATDLRADFVRLTACLTDIQTSVREQAQTVGQVLRIFTHPRSALDLVHSAWSQASATAQFQDRMAGSVTDGMPNRLTYAGGANKTVVVNIINR